MIKSRVECLECKRKRNLPRLTAEVYATRHNTETRHIIVVHHPDISFLLTKDGTIVTNRLEFRDIAKGQLPGYKLF
jgi:hypothetical protein